MCVQDMELLITILSTAELLKLALFQVTSQAETAWHDHYSCRDFRHGPLQPEMEFTLRSPAQCPCRCWAAAER
jgi:hypothetical protein